MRKTALTLTTTLVVLATASSAYADDDFWDRADFSMGFVYGVNDYHDAACPAAGCAVTPNGDALIEPFQAAGLLSVPVRGLRYDVTSVLDPMRFTTGLDIAFLDYSAGEAVGVSRVDGNTHKVAVQSVDPTVLRFGLGIEHAWGPVVAYADLLGSVHFVSSDLIVDGEPVEHSGRYFDLTARAGAQWFLREHLFAGVAGEVGLGGQVKYAGQLVFGLSMH